MMMTKNFNPEILAPVGNGEMLIAAVRSGADAVYLAGEDFNARRNAQNFSLDELAEAIRYCHIRNVKVYLALNTNIKEAEFSSAFNTAKTAYESGVDGIIIADLGLAEILHSCFPSLPLHASTQMSVHSVSALPILQKLGIRRVVVSREMSKTDIAEFVRKANIFGIETEVFVHGALCMSVSGQCLLSAVIGSRSGNRGLCAGPCRLPFSSAHSDYALSLKDLSLLEFTNELKSLGVASLKIEGRMKRPEYVAAAVTAFKEALNNTENAEKFSKNLKNVFSRSGFTNGYYVNRLGADMFGIRTREDVIASNEILNEIHTLYRAERQSVEIQIKAEIKQNSPALVIMSDGENTVKATGEVPQVAKTKAIDKEYIKSYLTKLGATPYFAKSVDITADDGLYLPGAAINELRRNCIEQLDNLRGAKKPIEYNEISLETPTEKAHNKKQIYCRFENAEQIPDNLDGIKLIILPLLSNIKLLENTETAVEIPRGILNEAAIKNRLKEVKKLGVKTAFCGTLAAMQLAIDEGLNVVADIGLNLFNSKTAAFLESVGVKAVMLSPELKAEELNNIKTNLSAGYFAYGRLPLMLTRNCPVNNSDCANCNKDRVLIDRMGVKFPVKCVNGFSVLLNSKPHYLADKAEDFKSLDFAELYFTVENRDEVEAIIESYKTGAKPNTDFTRGLYYRGVE